MTITTNFKTDLQNHMNNANTVPSNSKTIIKDAIKEMVASHTLIQSEKDHIDDIAKSLKDNHKIPVKVSKAVAKRVFAGEDQEKLHTEHQIDELYNDIMK
jgi:hypothetical protein